MKKIINLRLLVLLSVFVLIMGLNCLADNDDININSPLNSSHDSNALVLAGQDAVIPFGHEVERVVVFGADAQIDGTVREEVVVIGGSAYLANTAIIDGTIVVIGGKLLAEPEAKIYGEQVVLGIEGLKKGCLGFINVFPWGIGFIWWRFLVTIFIGVILYWLFPKPITKIADTINYNPAKVTLFGLLSILALAPLSLLLVITILGIPLVPIVWLLLLVANKMGRTAFSLLLGRYISTHIIKRNSEGLSLFLGLVFMGVVVAVPMVGGFISFFFSLVGIGAAVWSRLGTRMPIGERE